MSDCRAGEQGNWAIVTYIAVLKPMALIYVKDVNELHILKKINWKRFGRFRNNVYLCTAIQNNA